MGLIQQDRAEESGGPCVFSSTVWPLWPWMAVDGRGWPWMAVDGHGWHGRHEAWVDVASQVSRKLASAVRAVQVEGGG